MPILKVVPCVALPRHLGIYDYRQIEDGTEPPLGGLVEILFRGRRTWGLVVGFDEKIPTRHLNPIIRVVSKNSLLPAQFIPFLLKAASDYAVSPSLILKRLFPISPPGYLESPMFLPGSGGSEVKFCWSRAEACEKIREVTKDNLSQKASTLIVSPDLPQAQTLAFELAEFSPRLLQAKSGAREFWDTWNQVVSRPSLVIATSLAPFIPVYKLRSIIFDREEDPRHKHPDENPRLDRRALISARAKNTGERIIHIFESPRIDQALSFDTYTNQQTSDISITTHHASTRKQTHLTHLLETLTSNNNPRIALIVPGRGYGRHLICSDCGQRAVCLACGFFVYPLNRDLNRVACSRCGLLAEASITCPKCHGINWRYVGWGRERIAAEVGKNVEVLGQGAMVPGGVTGTFSHLVLGYPEYMVREDDWRADERLFGLILGAIARARDMGATLHIMTGIPEHLSIQFAISGRIRDFVERESRLRQSLGLPPATRIITIAYPKTGTTPQIIQEIKLKLAAKLTGPGCSISEMIHDRGWGRRRREGLLVIKIPRDLPYTSIFENIPPNWVIDVDPEMV